MKNKETILKFRVSEIEKKRIQNNVEKSQLSFSEYARKMLINGEIISISSEEKRIIGGLSNNINQLIKLYHVTHRQPDNLHDELINLLNTLKNAYRRST